MDSLNAKEKEHFSYDLTQEKYEATNPGDGTKAHLKMILESQRRIRLQAWTLKMLTAVFILWVLHLCDVKMDAETIIKTIAGNELVSWGGKELKKWR